MGRASKPMAKDANSRFQTRNNRSDVFSKFTKKADEKIAARLDKAETDKTGTEQPKES